MVFTNVSALVFNDTVRAWLPVVQRRLGEAVEEGVKHAKRHGHKAIGNKFRKALRHSKKKSPTPPLDMATALLQLFTHSLKFFFFVFLLIVLMKLFNKYARPWLRKECGTGHDDGERERDMMEPETEQTSMVMRVPGSGADVNKVLAELNLTRYQRDFERAGYDDWDEIVDMDREGLEMLCTRVQMAPNHADRVKFHVRRCKYRKRTGSAAAEEECVIL